MKRIYLMLMALTLFIFAGCAKESDASLESQLSSSDEIMRGSVGSSGFSVQNDFGTPAEKDDDPVETQKSSNEMQENLHTEVHNQAPVLSSASKEIDEQLFETWEIQQLLEETQQAFLSYEDYFLQIEPNSHGFRILNLEEQVVIGNILGEQGYAVANNNFNMPNYEVIQHQIAHIESGEDMSFGIYEIEYDGSLVRNSFISQDGKKAFFRIYADYNESGDVMLEVPISYVECGQMKLTDKGYFIFGTDKPGDGGFRITPLSDTNRKFTKVYVEPLGYVGHTALTKNWSQQDFSSLDFANLFETLYKMKFERNPIDDFRSQYTMENSYTIEIPAELFEDTITEYFQVPIEVLRQDPLYDAGDEVYFWSPHAVGAYPPQPEVVGYMENSDGTITLEVDAVMIDRGQDRAFTSRLTVEPKPDGGCYYISNFVDINSRAESSTIFIEE